MSSSCIEQKQPPPPKAITNGNPNHPYCGKKDRPPNCKMAILIFNTGKTDHLTDQNGNQSSLQLKRKRRNWEVRKE
jgi:hypothetical protein